MKHDDSHLSDQQLLLDLEGELFGGDEKVVRAHLDACWKCRARRGELEHAIADFSQAYQKEFEDKLPPSDGPRALLRAKLAKLSTTGWMPVKLAWAAALCVLISFGLILARPRIHNQNAQRPRSWIVSFPNSRLTPGATLLVSREAVCAEANPNNRAVPVSLQRKVFEEYGIAGADPGAYELDYLVTPALGGADEIHNLWPHSYSATVWNARVKDALEDRLRDMVCDGSLDLVEAQREIAGNWIEAYKKYFHTDEPLAQHHSRRD